MAKLYTTSEVCDKGKFGDLWVKYEDYYNIQIQLKHAKEQTDVLQKILQG
jgi:hypothetical protein